MVEQEPHRPDIAPQDTVETSSHWFQGPDVAPLNLSEEERARHLAREEEEKARAQARAEVAASVADTDGSKIDRVTGRPKGKILVKRSNPRLERFGASTIASAGMFGAWATKKTGYGLDWLLRRASQWGTDLIKTGEKDGPKLPLIGSIYKLVTTPLDWITFGRLRGKPAKTFGEVAAEEEKKRVADKKKQLSNKARIQKLVSEGGMTPKAAKLLVEGINEVDEERAENVDKKPAEPPPQNSAS